MSPSPEPRPKRGRPRKDEPPRPPKERTPPQKRGRKPGSPKTWVSGDPEHVPTDQSKMLVDGLASAGFTQEEIGHVVGVSVPTLVKHYAEMMKVAPLRANSRVAARLFRAAISDDPKTLGAAYFWMKTRARWREIDRPEDQPPPSPGLTINGNVNITQQGVQALSTQELKVLRLLYRKMGIRLPQEPPQIIDQDGRVFDAEEAE